MAKRLSKIIGPYKKERVKAAIRELARERGAGVKLPTIKEFCQSFGVTKVTLDTVLDALVVEGLIRRRRGSGIYVEERGRRAGRKRAVRQRVALVTELNILQSTTSGFFRSLFDHGREVLNSFGYPTRLYVGRTSPGATPDGGAFREVLEDARRGEIAGVLSTYTLLDSQSTSALQELRIPQVGDHPKFAYAVAGDIEDLARKAARVLARQGCRRPAILVWDPASDGDVVKQFAAEVRGAGMEFHSEWVRGEVHPNTAGAGWEEFREIWTAHKHKPDGLFIADDQLIPDVTRAIADARIRVPADLRVVALTNRGILMPGLKAMTRLEYDPEAQARAAAEMLIRLMRGEAVARRHVELGFTVLDAEEQPVEKSLSALPVT